MTVGEDSWNRFGPRPVPPPETAKGILRPRQQNAANNHARLPTSERVSRYVEWYWAVRWDRRGLPPFQAEVLSYPCVNITFERTHERTGGFVTGVWTTKYTRELAGEGETFGVKFRAGGFGAFTGLDVGALSDTSVGLAEIFPQAGDLAEECWPQTISRSAGSWSRTSWWPRAAVTPTMPPTVRC